MKKEDVKKFQDSHRDLEISPAKLEYSKFLYFNNKDGEILDIIGKQNVTDEDFQMESLIRNAKTPEDLLQLMRKPVPSRNQYNLRQKLLANEEMMIPCIEEKCLTNRQSMFIENALYFFLHCSTNVTPWILSNYANFKSEYLKGLFCLVLGFRGTKDMIPFLIREAERMEQLYPDESYDQGPALAVQELACRFLN